jgi:hypothetical protein
MTHPIANQDHSQQDPRQDPLPGMEHLVPDPPEATDPLKQQIAAIRQSNIKQIQDMARKGRVPNDLMLLSTRLETFIDQMLPSDTRRRWEFELCFEQAVAEVLERAAREIVQAALLDGINGPLDGTAHPHAKGNGLILP